MKTLIVIPTYDEIGGLAPLLEAALAATPSEVEILVVDDASPDGTGRLADAIARREPRVHVLHRAAKQGLGTAYVAGFGWGLQRDFEAFLEMDADFSHHPRYLAPLRDALGSSDVAIGSRYVAGGEIRCWRPVRRALSRAGSGYARLALGVPIRDFTGGFNAWRRRVLEAVDLPSLRAEGYAFQIELKYRAHRAGFRITELPIVFEDRRVGRSKLGGAIVLEGLASVWRLRGDPRRP